MVKVLNAKRIVEEQRELEREIKEWYDHWLVDWEEIPCWDDELDRKKREARKQYKYRLTPKYEEVLGRSICFSHALANADYHRALKQWKLDHPDGWYKEKKDDKDSNA